MVNDFLDTVYEIINFIFFVLRLLEQGCKVCLSDLLEDKGQETKNEFQKQFKIGDDEVCFVKCDVTVEADWLNLWNSAERFLNGPINILINNAGVAPPVSLSKILCNFLLFYRVPSSYLVTSLQIS